MQIDVLGPLRLVVDDEPITIAAAKERALLEVLAVRADQVVSTHDLIDALWGTSPPASAHKTLQTYVSNLRKVIGGALITEPPGYRLTVSADQVDARRFETLALEGREALHAEDASRASKLLTEALALYRGEPLVDLADSEGVRAEVVRLAELRVRVAEDRADAELMLGHHEAVVLELEGLVTEHPYREGLWALLMLALYRCGRQRDALRAYQRARTLFVDELGIEPGVELQTMERRVLAQDPALAGEDSSATGSQTRSLPSGTVTFCFTDIEGSTEWVDEVGDQRWSELLEIHRRLLREALTRDGHEVHTEGDAFFVAFRSAPEAVRGTADAQRAIEGYSWPDGRPLRVRMGLHTGEAVVRDVDYVGHDVHRASRICDAGHGGQILLSEATAGLVRDALPEGVVLADLGHHRLKDLEEPQRLFELAAPDLPGDFPPLRSLDAFAHNLPVQRSVFVGRTDQIAQVRALLGDHRLVTLTGIGGCGKTRLALQIGAEELEHHPGGVFFVDLAPVLDPDDAAPTVADAVGLQFGGGLAGTGRTLTDRTVESLARRRCLIVLDNCEHLLDACAELSDRILAGCPEVRVIATSREPLGVEGEQVHRVSSLSLPEGGSGERSEAVELFRERAKATRSDFELTPENAPAIAQICRRLDGIPLAIEFAAARVSHLSPSEIAERLDDRFHLLAGGRRRVQRQQTLEAALDWSYVLLSDPEQSLLRRLAVFSGSFGLPMVEAVCAGDGIERDMVLDLLGSLVDKSLVIAEPADVESRYRLLETVRTYAEAKLADVGESEAFRSGHRDAHLTWLESLSWAELYSEPTVTAAVIREHSNLRASLEWSQAQGRRDLVGRLAGRMVVLWQPGQGHGDEGRRWLSWALEDPGALDLPEQGACLVALAEASMTVGDPAFEEHALRAIELARDALGGPIVAAFGVLTQGLARRALATGDSDLADEARSLADEAVELARELGGPWPDGALFDHAMMSLILGDVAAAERSFAAVVEGDPESARAFDIDASIALAVSRALLGDPVGALDALGRTPAAEAPRGMPPSWYLAEALAAALSDHGSHAAENLETALRDAESGDVFLEINECLVYAAACAYADEDPAAASRLLAAAVQVGDARVTRAPYRSAVSLALYRHYLPLVRTALSPEESRRCRDEGRSMTRGEAMVAARAVADALRK